MNRRKKIGSAVAFSLWSITLFWFSASSVLLADPNFNVKWILLLTGASMALLLLSRRLVDETPFPKNVDNFLKAMVLVIVLMLLTRIVNTGQMVSPQRILAWLFLPLFYVIARSWEGQVVHWAAGVAALSYGVLLHGIENDNLYFQNLIALYFLSLPVLGSYSPITTVGLLGFTFLSEAYGATLILLLSLVPHLRIRWSWSIGGLGLAALMVLRLPSRYSYGDRCLLWQQALEYWGTSPWIGNAPFAYFSIGGTHYVYSHNFVLTFLAEYGIVGVAGGIFLLSAVVERFRFLPSWARWLLICFGVWSLFDEPLNWLGPLAVSLFALSRASFSLRQSIAPPSSPRS